MDYKLNETLTKFMEGEDIKSEEDLQKALDKFMTLYNSGQLEEDSSPMSRAYDYLDMAKNAPSKKKAMEYAKRALAIAPECLDATVFLCEMKNNIDQVIKGIKEGIANEKERLEEEGYFEEENIGHFYQIFETRPYIKSMSKLAMYLTEDKKLKEAKEIAKEILRLNETDNTGVRYILMGLYASFDEEEELEKLYQKYEEDCLETLIPFLILYYKRKDYPKAKEYLDKINKANKYFKQFFLGKNIGFSKMPLEYYTHGEPSEVQIYIENYGFLLEDLLSMTEFIQKDGEIKV